MSDGEIPTRRSRAARSLSAMGSVAGASLKPLREGATAAVLDSAWFESALADALDSEPIQAALKKALETEGAERVVETLFESGLVDEFVERLVADGAVWALIDGLLASDGAERLLSNDAFWSLIGKAVASDRAGELVDSGALGSLINRALAGDDARRLVATLFDGGIADQFLDRLSTSAAMWRLVDEIAASTAVTSAVTQQSLGFADQFGNEICARSRKADDWLLETAHRHRRTKEAPASTSRSVSQQDELEQRAGASGPPALARRPAIARGLQQQAAGGVPPALGRRPAIAQSDVRYVGIVSRSIAFGIDAGLISLVAFVVELGGALIVSVAHLPKDLESAMVAVGTALFALWALTYFVAFWSTTGQTPGARIMQFRVLPTNGYEVKPRRAVLRSIGLVLAAIPLFAGYLPVAFGRKRRGLHDYAARTIVVDAPRVSFAEQRRVAAVNSRR